MSASSLLQPENDPPKEGDFALESSKKVGKNFEKNTEPHSLGKNFQSFANDEYSQLQQGIFLTLLIVSALAVSITAFSFGLQAASSLLLGALFGLLYFRLLARSVGKLGKGSKNVSKVQLIVPVLLVLAVSRSAFLEMIPALLGFLLYKPSLIIHDLSRNFFKR